MCLDLEAEALGKVEKRLHARVVEPDGGAEAVAVGDDLELEGDEAGGGHLFDFAKPPASPVGVLIDIREVRPPAEEKEIAAALAEVARDLDAGERDRLLDAVLPGGPHVFERGPRVACVHVVVENGHRRRPERLLQLPREVLVEARMHSLSGCH